MNYRLDRIIGLLRVSASDSGATEGERSTYARKVEEMTRVARQGAQKYARRHTQVTETTGIVLDTSA